MDTNPGETGENDFKPSEIETDENVRFGILRMLGMGWKMGNGPCGKRSE